MADNVTITEGSGTTIAADEIASVKYQRVKLSVGDDGSATDANSGAGAVAAGTLRMTLASDDPAVVALQLIDNAISGNEMQVDVVSSALPTGAATAAKQPALGTAGSASSDVITVQGIASMTALVVDGSGVTQPVSGTVTANLSATDNAVLDQIELNTDYGTVTGGGTETGALRVTIANNSTGVVSIDDNGGSITVDGTVTANLSATDNTVLDNIDTSTSTLSDALAGEYETVAASQTDQILGATGGVGDFLSHIVVVPATTSPGAVSIKDGNGSAITVFTGGASSVTNLVPFTIALNMTTVNATTPGWKVTTGANVSVIGVGNFT